MYMPTYEHSTALLEGTAEIFYGVLGEVMRALGRAHVDGSERSSQSLQDSRIQ